jgi:AcrR family transcriptional regulator
MAEAERNRLLDAALGLAARQGWRALTLNAIAKEAGVPLSRVHGVFPSKWAILDAFADRVDEAVLARPAPAAGEPARDRLFDVLMRRFDAMQPHKAAVTAMAHDLGREPLAAFCAWPRLIKSMAWMLEAAGLDSSGLAGLVRTKGLAVLYLAALRTWLSDDSADLARTMATLDRGLRQAEAAVRFLDKGRKRSKPAKPAPTPRRRSAPRKKAARRR